MIPGQAIRKTSYGTVFSVIREIEIWLVALLMVNRYAGDAEANSFRRAVELRPKGESRRSAPKLAAEGDHAGRLSGVGSLVRRLADETRSHFSRPTESSRTSRLGAELSLVERAALHQRKTVRQFLHREGQGLP
jgi:hypothetical protein